MPQHLDRRARLPVALQPEALARAQIELVGLGAPGRRTNQARGPLTHELGSNLVDHRPCDLVLNVEHVVDRAIEDFGPQMVSALDLDELSGDAQAVARLTHPSLPP